jgi:S-DNA-T family DNA segregation ATPase FtsK/SpoIIIE
MNADQITMSRQLTRVSELAVECERYRSDLQHIQALLQDTNDQHERELAAVQQTNYSALQAELQNLNSAVGVQLETLQLDRESQVAGLTSTHQLTAQQLTAELDNEVANLEDRRKSETWVLQSILDEETNDSPIKQFEREADSFVNQKTYLDERFEGLQQQVQYSKLFLEHCHADMEIVLPAPTVVNASREELRDAAVETADLLLAEAAELEALHATNWVKGLRLWGLGFLGFLILWVAVIAIRADIRQFLNPELGKPDWEWVGVSALISLTVMAFVCLMLLMSVQGKLRDRFHGILQHFSNAEHIRGLWEQKSEKHIDRLHKTSEKWRREIDERRTKQTEKIKSEIDNRVRLLKSETAQKKSQLQQEIQRRTEQRHAEATAAETTMKSRLQQDLQRAEQRFESELQASLQSCATRHQQATADQRGAAEEVLSRWNHSIEEIRSVTQTSASIAAATLRWPQQSDWKVPQSMPECISVGDVLITVPKTADSIDATQSSSLCAEMPAVLRFPTDTSLLVEHDSAGREVALSFIRRQMLKLLTVIPAGRIRLTLIDPVGLGQSFSAMMHLADFDDLLIHSRIWTDGSQIRDQLQKVTEHMENIFQTYLRSQFDTIEEYNISAGEVAEPYHFVVVAGFPTAFTEESARHMASILTSGPRCGVHALVAWNPAIAAPPSFDIDDLTNNCQRFHVVKGVVQPKLTFAKSVVFEQFSEPPAEQYVKLVRDVGEQSKDARRVEVSFTRIAPRNDEIWSHSTADGIDLPIGRAGAARLQFMRLGRGTSQHVLVAGKTGSGKSTFLHILITNIALHYSPDEIQFYLIDFKKGVEFRTYAANKLPHARVVAIESDREFGLSVLERLDEILQERGELFRDRGVQDVPSFRERFPTEPMPRLLLLIDEFQEFFTAEDRVSARASLLLDRLVRQGRAFGIHLLLGSQTLGGAYSLARSTMGQIGVRIALQCSESDAHLILSEDNMAARLLARPGEAIYNDANGLVQGNHPFQIAWLDEPRREEAIRTMLTHQAATHSREYSMVVFEGNVAPTVEMCGPLNAWLSSGDDATRKPVDALAVWLGEPVAISAPACIELRRASGQNLLIVGQDETQVDSLLACTILSTCCRPHGKDELTPTVTLLHDAKDVDSQQRFAGLQKTLQLESLILKGPADCDAVVEELFHTVVARENNSTLSSGPEHVFVVRNIGQFRGLRKDEDDFGLGGFGEPKAQTASSMFSDVLKRGPLVGIHVVVWSDTFSNAIRWLSNSLLREFEIRIAFRMNQTDSASLVDTPVAASLNQGRAIIYRDQTGTTEKFRPFAWPSDQWLQTLVTAQDAVPELPFDIDSLNIE